MKGLPVLRPRERRLALIAVVVIGSWALLAGVVQPLWDRISDLSVRVNTKIEKVDAVSRILAQGPSIQRNYEEVAGYFERDDDQHAQDAFLNELEELSRRANLKPNLKPRSVKREGKVSRFEVELDVEGSQEAIMTFLDSLLAMPRLISVERLRIASVPAKSALLRANLVLQKLTVKVP